MRWLKAFWPAAMAVDMRERVRMVVGAGFGIAVTAVVGHAAGLTAPLTWIIAPMGASAVLVFCVPSSPMAQPWSVVGSHIVSAIAALLCVRWIVPVDAAVACAVALAIAFMLALRCLHPPGGATALLLAIGHVTDPHAILAPVLLNAAVLTACGIAYNNLTRRPYPHGWRPVPAAPAGPVNEPAIGAATERDLDAVLARYNEVLDVGRGELLGLFDAARLQARKRWLDETRCADIMTRDLVTVEFGTLLQDAWALLRERHIKALPVVDKWRRIVGILTLADFLAAAELDLHHGFDERLRAFVRATGASETDKPEVVGQIMTRRVRVTSEDRHLADLLPLFGSTGHHYIPVIGEGGRLVGMITQTDVVAALGAVDRLPTAAT